MSQLGGLARFTPSVLDKDTLEALFVHRESLVEDAVDRVRRASTSKERANRLFVGPRGAGKTHLVSLIAHRSRALDGFGQSFQLAWLPEDLWAIGDFDDLRKEILKAIEPREPLSDEAAMDGGPREFAGRVAARGPVVVIIENLDQVLDDLGPDGQRKLRAAIESDRSMLFIATATRLTADLLDQDSPFYGFFDTFDLQQFDVDQAADMLKAIARHRGDEALVEELDKPQARARLAAVAHLAGGQPRIWALFGAGLTVEGLDDLVSVLLERFDDLTPYYQEQLRRLSVNQRKAVQALAEADRALPVKALAELTGIDERSLSKTMSDLRKAGWVRARSGTLTGSLDGRFTYYELAEPLARLAFQLKAAHGQPVRLVVDFLRTWFTPDELEIANHAPLLGGYLQAARRDDPSGAVAVLCRSLGTDGDPSGGQFLDVSLGALLMRIDRGLEAYADGDAQPLMDLPGTVSGLVETRIDSDPVDVVRFDILRRGILSEDLEPWLMRLEGAAEVAEGSLRGGLLLLYSAALAASGEDLGYEGFLAEVRHLWSGDDVDLAIVSAATRSAGELAAIRPIGDVTDWMVDTMFNHPHPSVTAAFLVGLISAARGRRLEWLFDGWSASLSSADDGPLRTAGMILVVGLGTVAGPGLGSLSGAVIAGAATAVLGRWNSGDRAGALDEIDAWRLLTGDSTDSPAAGTVVRMRMVLHERGL